MEVIKVVEALEDAEAVDVINIILFVVLVFTFSSVWLLIASHTFAGTVASFSKFILTLMLNNV